MKLNRANAMESREKFVIALTLAGRREQRQSDLSKVIERFGAAVHVLDWGYGHNSLTVEAPAAVARELSNALPFATVELDMEIDLL
jgi:hypothetical protein